jgi:UDP-N-acetylmuramoyl-L-alanine---L-glutamate ligase
VSTSALESRRIAIWGYGREGRAAYATLRERFSRMPLTLFCTAEEARETETLEDPFLRVIPGEPEAAVLAVFDMVIKSPGISPYFGVAEEALALGAKFTSGTELWFAANPNARTICVTGTKGKSTTSALIAHLLRAGGHRTALAGNIGLPLLDLLEVAPPPAFWVIELSSYQTRDASNPEVAVILNLFPEHLDWHGSEARYFRDKLALLHRANPRHAVLNAADSRLAKENPRCPVSWLGTPDGWHARGSEIWRGETRVLDSAGMLLAGAHNRINLCAALAAVEALGLDAIALAPAVLNFQPLPHRLQRLGIKEGIEYINDSISTTPHASIAALDCLRGRRVAIIVGGYDRGLDWGVFVERVQREPPAAVVTVGQNGPRIAEALRGFQHPAGFTLFERGELEEAVRAAESAVSRGGVVLLSPGAPSFPRYRDYVERGQHFAKASGFRVEAMSGIPGMGVG